MVMYRTSQEQMNDVLAFGMSLMFIGFMFGLVKSLVSIALEPRRQSPKLLPQTKPSETWWEGDWLHVKHGTAHVKGHLERYADGSKAVDTRVLERGTLEDTENAIGVLRQKFLGEKRYGVWDSYFDPEAAYTEARQLRQQGWLVRVTERQTPQGKKYYVWIDGKKTSLEMLPQVLIEGGEPVPSQYRYLAGWLQEPLPGYSLLTLLPAVEPEVKERRIDAVLRQLKDGVEDIQQSDKFRLFLSTMAKFHDYSIGNLILIAIQKPNATRVAGFNTWKDLSRWVKRGEKGVSILAPVMPPKPKPEEKEEEEKLEEIELRPVYFKVVYVFDVSQTEGKPLPEFEVPVLSGEANEELFGKVMTLAKGQGLEVNFESRPYQDPSIKGTYFGKSIWVRPDETRAQQLKTLLHEVAHYYSEGVFHIPRRDAETIAESAAFAIGAHFGFDTGVRSFPYVALWAKDKKVLEQNLTAIRKVATAIIDALEQSPPLRLLPQTKEGLLIGQFGRGALK